MSIIVQNVTKQYDNQLALNDVSLTIGKGEIVGLLGPNGAGKSTLMKCLFGVYQEDGGEIILDGKKEVITTSKQALDLGISMIHQELHPIRFRPVMENIWLGRFPKKGIAVDKKAMIRKTEELFKEVDLNINPQILVQEKPISLNKKTREFRH